jgi:exopolysaccharide biosynthesis polyprenyl glycosylphosphotransferase
VSDLSKPLGTLAPRSAERERAQEATPDSPPAGVPVMPLSDTTESLPAPVGGLHSPLAPSPQVRPLAGIRSVTKLKGWMLVLPMDVLALCTPLIWTPGYYKAFISMAALSLLLLTGGGRYRARLHVSVLDELPIVLSRMLAAGAIVATVFAIRHEEIAITVFLESALIGMIALIIGRIVTSQIILIGRRRRIVAHPTVIVGGDDRALELAVLLNRYPQYGLHPVGLVGDSGCGEDRMSYPHLGAIEDLESLVKATSADVIIIADAGLSQANVLDVVRRPACNQCDVMIVPWMQQFYAHGLFIDHIGTIPVMRVRKPGLTGPVWAIKRVVDVLVSATLLLVLAPLLAVCALGVRLEGGPGVLFRQERVGRDGKLFTCLKFRSMKPASSIESATTWSIANDDRVGRIGRVLRRTSLDELPQLWNVLRGDMTLVGPRPERPVFVRRFSEEVPRYGQRHRVPSGLTGLAQVSGLRGDVPIADRARFDNYYIENWSLWLDVKVLLRTFTEVLFARGR